MRNELLRKAQWRKSRASQLNGNCVEVASLDRNCFAVRDSKDQSGPALIFDVSDWAGFTAEAKKGLFALR
ncbi:DUF397 domain-containing protein [Flindersiella endophytica]